MRVFSILGVSFLLSAPFLNAAPPDAAPNDSAAKSVHWSDLKPEVVQASGFGESPELIKLGPGQPVAAPDYEGTGRLVPIHYLRRSPNAQGALVDRDPVIQTSMPVINTPSPNLSFDGINNVDGFVPPDTVGAIGPSNYVQMVNSRIQVFNRFTGAAQTSANPISSLFASLGGGSLCATTDDGDPVVVYDQLADRWLVAQFANSSSTTGPFYMSIAVSKTPDPTGAYYAYCFQTPSNRFPDYFKFGVWPDGYYMTANQFSGAGSYQGAGVFAFDRTKMLAGDPTAKYIYFNLGTSHFGMLPAGVDGPPPPIGTPNYFVEYTDTPDTLRVFDFHADFATTNLSTFAERTESPITVASFNPNVASIPQSGTTQTLDTLADRLMFRLQYRNFSSNEALTVTHTVVGGSAQAAIRYYTLRRNLPGGTFNVRDQATYAPDTLHRWMGSAALNYRGDLAVGYSCSSSTNFPSIRYAARLSTDPTNQLTQGEAILIAGGGSQTGASRWGDYSAMTVDPNDDCTFWYTQEYYASSSSAGWRTRIGSFTLPGCTAAPRGTIHGNVTNAGAPVTNAAVSTTSGYLRFTDAAGNYSMTVSPGTYDMSAIVTGVGTSSVPGVVVVDGGTTTQNFSLGVTMPVLQAGGAVLTAEGCSLANSAIDPNETVSLNFAITNAGLANASNVVATLQATGGVTAPSGAQSYGTILTGGTVNKSFSFTASGTCGGSITATLLIQTNAATYGSVAFNFPLGALGAYSAIFSQNFDGVTAPTLPAGWTTARSSTAVSNWVTSITQRDTLPNAAYSPSPGSTGTNQLVSPSIAIVSGAAQLTFHHRYDLEATSTIGYDGGVLEIKVGSGAFQDILTAGGSFASNGYTRTISSSFSNPLGGRQAWSGRTNGFITTSANLPASAAGQNIQLRWICGTDSSVGSNGWFIDTISINDSNFVCCTSVANQPPVISAASISPLSPMTTNILVASVTSSNDPDGDPITLAYQWQQSTNNATFSDIAFTAATLPAAATIAGDYYLVIITPNDGKVNGASFPTASVLVALDSDSDGLNDDWELTNFGSLAAQTGTGDPDGDGFSNAQEFVAGTDPNSASSMPVILSVEVVGNDIVVSFASVSGKHYELQRATDLVTPNWGVVETNIAGTGGTIQKIDTGAASLPVSIYRVRVLP